ncbi:MAG TPA: hypothetical protein VNK04_06830 [Gemmataceae bacterium]|nr:hypothetical protein [Gemmataceae bacterium]
MNPQANNLVPKVHPLTRDVAPEDPMELVATPVPGDPDVMLQCLVQEFAWMGWNADQLLGLFRSPAYPVLNQLREYYGDDVIRQRIHTLLGRSGVFRVQETIAADPEPAEEEEPELIPLSVRRVVGD